MSALRLAEAMRPGPGESRGSNDHGRALTVQHSELAALGHARLMHVAREDELGAGLRELREHVSAAGERPLARPPRRVRELVVEAHDAQCARRRRGELFGRTLHCPPP